MVLTGTGKMGDHFPVMGKSGNLIRLEKSGKILPKILGKWE